MMHWGQSLGCKTGPVLDHGQYNSWKQDRMLLFIGMLANGKLGVLGMTGGCSE